MIPGQDIPMQILRKIKTTPYFPRRKIFNFSSKTTNLTLFKYLLEVARPNVFIPFQLQYGLQK